MKETNTVFRRHAVKLLAAAGAGYCFGKLTHNPLLGVGISCLVIALMPFVPAYSN
jgi:hypothetical protein